MRRDENSVERWLDSELDRTEMEESRSGQLLGNWVPGPHGSSKKLWAQASSVSRIEWGAMAPGAILFEYLCPGMSFNLGELELCVAGIQLSNRFPGWCSQHLDALYQLVHPTVPREDGLA